MKHISFKQSALYGRVSEFIRWKEECGGTVAYAYAYTEYTGYVFDPPAGTFDGLVFSNDEDAVAFRLKFGI
jgi:hypothetical protein